MTEWRIIEGFERYEVSDDGRVRYAATQRERSLHLTHRGYHHVSMIPGPPAAREIGKKSRPLSRKVHRLVAITFIPNPDNLPEVNHLDCDKTNNAVGNLEWVDRMGNYWHAHSAGIWHGGTNPNRNTKYTIEIIAEVRRRFAEGEKPYPLGVEYGMSPAYCSKVCRNLKRQRG